MKALLLISHSKNKIEFFKKLFSKHEIKIYSVLLPNFDKSIPNYHEELVEHVNFEIKKIRVLAQLLGSQLKFDYTFVESNYGYFSDAMVNRELLALVQSKIEGEIFAFSSTEKSIVEALISFPAIFGFFSDISIRNRVKKIDNIDEARLKTIRYFKIRKRANSDILSPREESAGCSGIQYQFEQHKLNEKEKGKEKEEEKEKSKEKDEEVSALCSLTQQISL